MAPNAIGLLIEAHGEGDGVVVVAPPGNSDPRREVKCYTGGFNNLVGLPEQMLAAIEGRDYEVRISGSVSAVSVKIVWRFEDGIYTRFRD